MLSTWLRSDDGGFGFAGTDGLGLVDANADAYRADLSVGLGDLFAGTGGRVTLYAQKLDAGYSTASLTRAHRHAAVRRRVHDSAHGPAALWPRRATSRTPDRRARHAGRRARPRLPAHRSLEPRRRRPARQPRGRLADRARDAGGGRAHRRRRCSSATTRRPRWRSYGFVQGTLAADGNREDNARVGVGGAYRVTDRFVVDAEGLGRPARPGRQARHELPGDRPHHRLPELRARGRARRRRAVRRAAAT